MTNIEGYITKRALDRDAAEESGEYLFWPVLEVDLPAQTWAWLELEAERHGIGVDDLVAVLAEERARRVLEELLR